jgi:hypothetical protein
MSRENVVKHGDRSQTFSVGVDGRPSQNPDTFPELNRCHIDICDPRPDTPDGRALNMPSAVPW